MKAILLLALSAIILSQSYGFVYADHMSNHMLSNPFSMTIVTDSSSYEAGEMINISGSVSDYDESDTFSSPDVTITVLDPKNNRINLSQIPLDSDGSFSTYISAQGPLWKVDGDYTIFVSHGTDRNTSITFAFILAPEEVIEEVIEEEIEISEEELAEGCGEGTHLEDGVCMLDETTESTSVSTGSAGSATTGFSAWVYSITFTVLIAFVIMIILYVVSRASRRKIAN